MASKTIDDRTGPRGPGKDSHACILSLAGIRKSFSGTEVLHELDLSIDRGEFVTLLGPSGCGKTTTIRIVAGLEQPDGGRVLLAGKDVTSLPPDKRRVNTVFQNYALFPHMNVFKNVAYGLKIQGVPKEEIRRRVKEILELVELPGYEERRPTELSGGQRQRVAIARALVLRPEILLLDEPLGALDLQLRRQMQRELKAIQSRLGITFIYITHDQEEALNMSDRIVVMREGRIEQSGTPAAIYERPATRFAATFIGESNILDGTVGETAGGACVFRTAGGACLFAAPTADRLPDDPGLCIRPDDIKLTRELVEGFGLAGVITDQQYTGSILRTAVRLGDGTVIKANRHGRLRHQMETGETVQVSWNPAHAALIGGYKDEELPPARSCGEAEVLS